MVIFAMHLSYGLIGNPFDFRVFEYISHHISAYYMHPYRAFRRRRYSTFNPFSTHTFFLCLGFTSHMISINEKFNLLVFQCLGMPKDIKNTTSLPSCASTMRLVNKASREMVGEDGSSSVMYYLCGNPYAHTLPFSFPLNFDFIRFISRSLGTSWPCVYVFTLLSLYIACFSFPFILVFLCIIILVFFYLFCLFHLFIFNYFICAVISDGSVFLVVLILVFDDVIT